MTTNPGDPGTPGTNAATATNAATTPEPQQPAAAPMRTFGHLLVNTAVANITTSYLWWALIFWVYLETRNVLATGLIGGDRKSVV